MPVTRAQVLQELQRRQRRAGQGGPQDAPALGGSITLGQEAVLPEIPTGVKDFDFSGFLKGFNAVARGGVGSGKASPTSAPNLELSGLTPGLNPPTLSAFSKDFSDQSLGQQILTGIGAFGGVDVVGQARQQDQQKIAIFKEQRQLALQQQGEARNENYKKFFPQTRERLKNVMVVIDSVGLRGKKADGGKEVKLEVLLQKINRNPNSSDAIALKKAGLDRPFLTRLHGQYNSTDATIASQTTAMLAGAGVNVVEFDALMTREIALEREQARTKAGIERESLDKSIGKATENVTLEDGTVRFTPNTPFRRAADRGLIPGAAGRGFQTEPKPQEIAVPQAAPELSSGAAPSLSSLSETPTSLPIDSLAPGFDANRPAPSIATPSSERRIVPGQKIPLSPEERLRVARFDEAFTKRAGESAADGGLSLESVQSGLRVMSEGSGLQPIDLKAAGFGETIDKVTAQALFKNERVRVDTGRFKQNQTRLIDQGNKNRQARTTVQKIRDASSLERTDALLDSRERLAAIVEKRQAKNEGGRNARADAADKARMKRLTTRLDSDISDATQQQLIAVMKEQARQEGKNVRDIIASAVRVRPGLANKLFGILADPEALLDDQGMRNAISDVINKEIIDVGIDQGIIDRANMINTKGVGTNAVKGNELFLLDREINDDPLISKETKSTVQTMMKHLFNKSGLTVNINEPKIDPAIARDLNKKVTSSKRVLRVSGKIRALMGTEENLIGVFSVPARLKSFMAEYRRALAGTIGDRRLAEKMFNPRQSMGDFLINNIKYGISLQDNVRVTDRDFNNVKIPAGIANTSGFLGLQAALGAAEGEALDILQDSSSQLATGKTMTFINADDQDKVNSIAEGLSVAAPDAATMSDLEFRKSLAELLISEGIGFTSALVRAVEEKIGR